MKKVYYLSTCTTCKRIIKDFNLVERGFEMHDIKNNQLSEKELEILAKSAGSYEAIFSKRAQLFKKYELGLKELSENDYKTYLLEHYTFLKRPVIVSGNVISCGNSKSELLKIKE